MAPAFYVLIILVAACAWVVVVYSLIGMLRATNSGKLNLLRHAGIWDRDKVSDILGPVGAKHLRRMKLAAIWFLGAIAASFAVVIAQIALEAK